MNDQVFEFEEQTICDLQKEMSNGNLTSVEVTSRYLKRIAEFDKQGSAINAVLELNPDALFIAESLDVERENGKVRSQLHGVPVLLKDNINTADKTHTSAGSLSLANHYATKDAFIVEKLREAGAVILGKANMTEWANFMTENMPNGYSSRGGLVLNPYGPGKFDVGGSSAGSGASIAANFAAVAVGTETSGSIIHPASYNSIVGIKPTVGLVSRSGIIPIAHSQDTAGPMARTVADAATLLSIIAGIDENDPVTRCSLGKVPTNYIKCLDPNGLDGARIGVPRRVYYDGLSASQLNIMERALNKMRELGAVIVDPVDISTATPDWEYTTLLYEFKSDLNAYLHTVSHPVSIHSLADVIAFNQAHEETALKYGQTIMHTSESTSGTLTESTYIQARFRDLELSRHQGIDKVILEQRLDAIVFPGAAGCDIAAKAGYPSITVPGGYTDDGEPLGITFCGMAYAEPVLIRLGYAFEQNTRYRISPVLAAK